MFVSDDKCKHSKSMQLAHGCAAVTRRTGRWLVINGSPAKAEKPREVVPCNAAGSIFYLPEAPLLAVLLLRLTRGILTSVLHPVRREAVASGRSMIDTCKAIAELCACLVCGLTLCWPLCQRRER